MRHLTRRDLLKGSLAAGAAVPALAARQAAAQQRLTVTVYAGVWEKGMRDTFMQCFKKDVPNVEVDLLTGNETDWIAKIQANPQKPPIQVMLAGTVHSLTAKARGLLEKIDPAKVPNLKDLAPDMLFPDGYGVIVDWGAGGLVFNKEVVKEPPKSWQEFIERAAKGEFGRKVMMPSINYAFTDVAVIWAWANAFGGDVDKAFDAIKRVKPNVVKWWASPADVVKLLATREGVIGPYFDGRAWAMQRDGNPWVGYVNPAPGVARTEVAVHKIVGSPDAAWNYINCMIDPVAQAAFSEMVLYAMSNPKVKYPASVAHMISKPSDTIRPPIEEILKQRVKWVERWNKEIGG
jgi:putative spermidine/putrescine transport system substrate-binding protein